ncbi:HNH endonuclease [Hymenobacter latericus]|uniref:HNH endonuclease n=1 Tax=Hymenobacter sp. YIM 151858-1 TaxID=2987688 RepID=UPI0022271111|nr:HNH endonuclease [Hymenobacter sp. YIM 151858-1]UYZ58169.1 HNH endonuclease [Hymenobacter sp. YIM 151858-1]
MDCSYLHRFTHLRVARSRQHGEAPYKPALLLAVLDGIEDGSIQDNRVYITPELLAAFRSICRDLSTSALFRANDFSLPFYHLSGDGFWHLRTLPGLEVLLTASRSVKSFRNLRDTVEYAYLDAELWALLQQPAAREELRQALLLRYFPQTRFRYQPCVGTAAVQAIRKQMLEEPAAQYRTRVAATDELDAAVRSGLFKRVVLDAYDYTCAISGLKLITTQGAAPNPLLDACHIVPWALSHDDTLPNGLALTPTLHRAFDRKLLWVDDDYRVRLTRGFDELAGEAHGIRQFEGRALRLPAQQEWWPSLVNLRQQRGGCRHAAAGTPSNT